MVGSTVAPLQGAKRGKGLLVAADRMELAERFDKRLLGLGLYWAWLFVTFYTPVLFPAADAAADLAREAWSWAAWAHALTLLVCAALGHRLSAFADSRRVVVGTAILCTAGTACVPLGQWLSTYGLAVSWGLPVMGAVATGVSTAWLVLLYGRLFAREDAACALWAIGGAYLLSCIVYFLVRAFDPLVAIATTLVLPAASALALLLPGSGVKGATEKEGHPSLRINWRAAMLLAVLFFFAFGGEMFRGFAVPSGSPADLGHMGDLYMAGGVAGLVVLGAAIAVRVRSSHSDGHPLPGMQSVLVIMALSFLCTVLFGTSYAMGYAVFGAGFMFCRCVVWAYCAVVSRRVRASSFTVFGIVQASFALAVVVGVPLSQRLSRAVASGAVAWDAIAVTFLFLIVVVAVLATSKSDFEIAWGLVPQARSFGKGEGPAAASRDATAHAEGPAAPRSLEELLQDRFALTPRECDVAELLARGRSLPFIQKELHISQGTAQSHLTHIYRKLQVHSRQEFIDVIDGVMPDQGGE